MDTMTLNTEAKNTQVGREDRGAVYSPAVDVYEEKDRYLVYADIPGAGQSDVEIAIEKDMLTIRAEVGEAEQSRGSLKMAEYGIGRYARSFRLAQDVDRDRIEAVVQNGVLRLLIPRIEPSVRRIEVRAQ